MSNNLRDALEQLVSEREAEGGATPSDYAISPHEVRDLLAAHPVEPAADEYSLEEIAAKVADRVPHADLDGFSLSERLRIGKAVAPLFQDLLGTRRQPPITSREPEGEALEAMRKWYADMDLPGPDEAKS